MKESQSSDKVFAKGKCGLKLFLVFVVGSILGTYYEQIINFIKFYLIDGTIFWEPRRGVLYGPFSPIYGCGAFLMVLLFSSRNLKWWQIIVYGALFGGFFEYGISLLQETFTGMVSWDYSNHFLNINGRTTIPFMLVWGIFTWIFVICFYPWLSRMIEKIPYNLGIYLTYFLIVFLTLDMFVSWTAIIRQGLRSKGYPPYTFLGKVYDNIYPDEVMKKHFPNMFSKEELT